MTSGFAADIGAATASMAPLAKAAVQVGAYSAWGGLQSGMTGGNVLSGVISGAVGSGMASGVGAFTNNAFAQVGSAALAGGVTAELTGGEFWRGATTAGIIAGFNHVTHRIQDGIVNKRMALAKWAENHWMKRSTKWAFNSDPQDVNKCNLFVFEGLTENGMSPYGHALRAGDWGNPDIEIPGYIIVDTPQRGDIGAYKFNYQGASGHMGIMKNSTHLLYANKRYIASTHIMNYSDWANKNWVYRRYLGTGK